MSLSVPDVDNGGDGNVQGQGVCGKPLCLPPNFAVNLKNCLLNNKVY